jgi:uncharacterized beta-barrel protein YwiB (DUF1934 family)
MKDITLKITGKQISADQEEDQMEFVTEGKLYEKNGALYLIYEESEFSGMPGCKTSLKMTPECIRMKRIGESSAFGMDFVFEKGKRFQSSYRTPYGVFDMEVLTNNVVNNLTPEGTGDIFIDYHTSLNGMREGRNCLSIEVTQ